MNEVTVILTSCGRFDLLRRTLDSFFKFNTYPVKEFWICDDSYESLPEWRVEFPFIKWPTPTVFKNQIASLDLLWSLVKTPYAFVMEDDWEFLQPGFIEASMEVLQSNPKIMMVWLKELEPLNVSPIEFVGTVTNGAGKISYGIFKRQPNLWAWHRFNPSLKRKADYDLIAPFSKHTTWNPNKPWKSEADISKGYHNLGFTAAILPTTYITHIGNNRHVG